MAAAAGSRRFALLHMDVAAAACYMDATIVSAVKAAGSGGKTMDRRSRMNWKSALTALVFGLLIMPAMGAAQTAKIKMGSSLSPASLESITPYVAIEKGIFKKLGIDAEVVEFRGDATH